MFRHGRVMFQIKNLLVAGSVEINFVSFDGNKRGLKIAVILRPVSQTGCEKVTKTHFVDFGFDLVAKEKGQRAHFGICY